MGFGLDRAVACNDGKRQIERSFGIGAGRQAIKLEAELGATGGRRFHRLRNGQRPLRRGAFDKQFDRFAGGCAEIDRDLTPLRTSTGERLSRIQAGLAAAGKRPVQHSLFDSRAEMATRKAESNTSRLLEALARRHSAIASPASAANARTTLVAAWPRRVP